MHGAEVGSLSAQGRLGLLVEASAHLAGTLDLRAVAWALAHSVVPELSDRAEVDLVEAISAPFPLLVICDMMGIPRSEFKTVLDATNVILGAGDPDMLGGAEDVVAYCTHGVLSGGAAARVQNSVLSELVITDSIAAYEAAEASEKIRLLTIAPLLAEAIKRIADESSVSSLFD